MFRIQFYIWQKFQPISSKWTPFLILYRTLQVSYIKAVDSYLIVSFIFVFGVLLEYVAVLMHSRHKKGKAGTLKDSRNESPSRYDLESSSSFILSSSNRSSQRLSRGLSSTEMNIISACPLSPARSPSQRQFGTKSPSKDSGNFAEMEHDMGYPVAGYSTSSIQRHSSQRRFSKDLRETSITDFDVEMDCSYPLTGYSPAPGRKHVQYTQAGVVKEPMDMSGAAVAEDGFYAMNYPHVTPHQRSSSSRASKDSRDMSISGIDGDVSYPVNYKSAPKPPRRMSRHSKELSMTDVIINDSRPNNLRSILRRSSKQVLWFPFISIYSPFILQCLLFYFY